MPWDRYRFDGDRKYAKDLIATDDKHGLKDKEEGQAVLAKNREGIAKRQEVLYAEGKQSLIVILQAMDAAGKDGTIRHVFTGVDPHGIEVTSFKQPTGDDLDHDYLWRVHRAVPPRGSIGVFNRSHYEDVLIGKVLNLPDTQPMPDSARKDIFHRRYRQIRDFERMLSENGATIIKIYLCLSRKEQAKRFLDRAADDEKHWKFTQSDVETSERWKDYMSAYEDAINETATPYAPWYVIPADAKWYARAVISSIVLDTLDAMKAQFPRPTKEQSAALEAFLQAAKERA